MARAYIPMRFRHAVGHLATRVSDYYYKVNTNYDYHRMDLGQKRFADGRSPGRSSFEDVAGRVLAIRGERTAIIARIKPSRASDVGENGSLGLLISQTGAQPTSRIASAAIYCC